MVGPKKTGKMVKMKWQSVCDSISMLSLQYHYLIFVLFYSSRTSTIPSNNIKGCLDSTGIMRGVLELKGMQLPMSGMHFLEERYAVTLLYIVLISHPSFA